MSTSVTLYLNKSEPRVLHKELVNANAKTCSIYNPCTIVNPVLRIRFFSGIVNYNYVYSPQFNRYYYIVEQTMESAEVTLLHCRCDVLMSFVDDIENLTCNIIRQEDKARRNPKIADAKIQGLTTVSVRNLTFDHNPFTASNGRYVMTVIGGANTQRPDGGETT